LHVTGSHNGKALGLGQTVPDLVMSAYGVQLGQIKWNTPAPAGIYDFIANLPAGNLEAGQKGIQQKFGLAIHRETIQTNALILRVLSRDAAGLKRSAGNFSGNEQENSFSAHNQNIWTLVDYLDRVLGLVILDQTQLTGNFDIDFIWDKTPDGLKQVLRDQLGLDLVPTNMPVEMVVIDPAGK
jgi:uncharacterized protein (TIGR03435 family)